MTFKHIPIMVDEVIKGLNIKKDGTYIDGTIGGAGHALEVTKRLDKGLLVGIDQDKDALKKAEEVLSSHKDKVILVHSNYEKIDEILNNLNIDSVDGIFLDIGVSSYQLDKAQRGFSYHQDAGLDMRMNKDQKFSAWDVVNKYSEKELSDIIWQYGEERWAKRIAQFIVKEREKESIDTTGQLVEVIKKAIPKQVRMGGQHPARKTFQAIRIEVNRELEVLENALRKMPNYLNPGGRLAVISFHSLEDRIVKQTFRYLFQDCICPPELPQCACDKEREVKILTRRPITPSKREVEVNPRSRSAKLRIVEKL
ncbi:MAG TPA: 16S rRNA (cytosine(1402)-N(4))-methyltransferase RsmH [Tissierellaceae bacterium]|nr:16S rRNA (cytosine(1402)-N(4))-methyltransferase RsmH [Tissierellaceae bacterium]